MRAPDTSTTFDPLEEGYTESPYEQYARLREHDPVHWSPLLEGWVVTRYDDVVAVLREPTISVELINAQPTSLVVGEQTRMAQTGHEPSTLVLRDDPDHARLRRLLQQPFSPRAIDGLRGMISRRIDDALDVLIPRGHMDVIDDFAYPFPVGVFCEMFGVPEDETPQMREWTSKVAKNLDPVMSKEEREECMRGHDDMYAYLEQLIERKREQPADDILTSLVHAEEDGDKLTRDELTTQVVTLYVAGHEPTTSLIGRGLLELLRRPDQMALLRARPELMGSAVLELLRYDGPNQFVRRIATRDMKLGGRAIEAGHVLFLCVGSANRDPARWGDGADELDIEREDASQHLQFGTGVHHCLGAHLARLQAELALGALLDRTAAIELAGDPVWSPRMVIRGLQNLPVTYTAA
ncbi:MAG: cytochrome P450 [Actinobacteria bacterium]|nr:cytochrome P450 [Actinomycetota bacterium]